MEGRERVEGEGGRRTTRVHARDPNPDVGERRKYTEVRDLYCREDIGGFGLSCGEEREGEGGEGEEKMNSRGGGGG